jgi:hypothetical protein
MTTHHPERPAWRCRECGDPWPCEQAHTDLNAEFADNRMSLMMLLAAHALDAIDDGVDVSFERFIGWARRRRSVVRVLPGPRSAQRRAT